MSKLFREVALERLSSPEQLDQVLEVTTPRGWLALGALGGLLAAALAWGVAGSIPDRVDGAGILLQSGGVAEVVARGEGQLTEVGVAVGDRVREGQVVARFAQHELDTQIRQVRARVAEHEAQHRQIAEFGARDTQLQGAYLAESRGNLEQSIAASEAALEAIRQKVRNEEELVRQGLITRQTLLATVQQMEQVKEKVRTGRGELAQLRVGELQGRNENDRKLEAALFQLQEARRELARLEGERRTSSEVVSPYTGRVLEVIAERGAVLGRGAPVLVVDLEGSAAGGVEAVVFVPSVHGKKVRPGMEIQIAPSTVQREEYGYLLGTVTRVSDYPTTRLGMNRVLKNDQLVSALAAEDAPYVVHARLRVDPRTASGYRWTSPGGPPLQIRGGTLARAHIVTQRRRPISFLFPRLARPAAAAPRKEAA